VKKGHKHILIFWFVGHHKNAENFIFSRPIYYIVLNIVAHTMYSLSAASTRTRTSEVNDRSLFTERLWNRHVSGRNATRLIDNGWDLGVLINRRSVVLVSPSKPSNQGRYVKRWQNLVKMDSNTAVDCSTPVGI